MAPNFVLNRPISDMVRPDFFEPATAESLLARIDRLQPDTPPRWGRMNAAQMLAHNSVAFEMVYTDRHPQPGPLMRWMLRTFIKGGVVGPKPYPHNARTAPAFVVADERVFAAEKERLVAFIRRAVDEGPQAFEGRESPSFGPLTAAEWSTLFEKHLDHHLQQFGV